MNDYFKSRFTMVALLAATVMVIAGCAQTPGPNSYTPEEAMALGRVSGGTVLSVRQVVIRPNAQTASAGSLAGSVVGGVAGASMGGGYGSTLLAIGGAILGSIVGRNVENSASTRNALQVFLKMDDGRTLAVVQPLGVKLYPGQSVWVTRTYADDGGRYRVIPRSNKAAATQ